jgi:phosphatidylserine synthase
MLLACYIAFVVDVEELRGAPWLIQLIHSCMAAPDFKLVFFLVSMPYLALMMVSNVIFRSHKKFSFRYVRPFKLLVILVIVVGLMTYRPALTGFLFFFLYACSGPLEWVLGWKKPADDDEIFPPYLGEEGVEEDASSIVATTHEEEAP